MKSLVYSLLLFIGINHDLQAQTMSQSFGTTSVSLPGQSANTTVMLTGGNYFQKQNLENNNNIGLPGYTAQDEIDNDAYLSKDWVKGSVTATDRNIYGADLVFMYDKINGNLYFRKPDSAVVMQADMDKIISFNLLTDKPHVFIKSDFFAGADKNKFYEVLVLNDKNYSLFKFTKREYQQSNDNKAAQAITQSLTSGAYQDKTTYFLYYNSVLKPVELRKAAFLDAMVIKKDKADLYCQNHKGKFNEDYVIKMLNEINQQ
ncbi:MAG: hypothetical protein JO072_12520 [Parafilimonas sp.]|nr:hypothetical protein [Parafilimonas sp.]